MRSQIIIPAIIIALTLAIIPLFSEAQATIGCCCDPVVRNGSFATQTDCSALGFTFVGAPPNMTVTCSQHCNATLPTAARAVCGDGICQANETAITCPQDCAVTIPICGSPTYKPAPTNLEITPAKGEKAFRLSFGVPCPAIYIEISRCQGTGCADFKKIAEIPPTTIFTDEDEELEFNKDYAYSVVAHYVVAGASEPASETGNLGDLECWQQGTEKFCISNFYYDTYTDYLTKIGYGQYTGREFGNLFGRIVNLTFASKFNRAWQCNDQNLLTEASPRVTCDIKKNEYCISDENGPRCAKRETCSIGFEPFGLFATQQTCEGTTPRYCFFDKSKTTVNKCYNCDPKMTCYDYKSRGACEKDNCAAGVCQWNPIFEDLGIGTCIDKRYNNCRLCDTNGTQGIGTQEAISAIWDDCREEKSNALSNQPYPCFFDKDRKNSKTCNEAICLDYTEIQCSSPEGGIQLNPDNSPETTSTDVCGIKVCEYLEAAGCIKDADGDGIPDCKFGDRKCEQDYFAPNTTLIPTGTANKIDNINIRIFDKTNRTSPSTDQAGKPGYKTYLCIKNETNNCNEAKTFNIIASSPQLILKNKILKEGKRALAQLQTGNNTIVYYSKDPANNPEILKEIKVYACESCNGPTLLNLTVTGGMLIGNTIYTSATKPTFTFEFDEPTQITYAEITRPGETVKLTQTTTGMADTHSFTPTTELLGIYNLSLNGHNEKTIYFDPPGLKFNLIADPNLAGLTITPADGSIINKTSADVTLNFTRPVTLEEVTLISESFEDPHVKKETRRSITSLFKTTNNYTFTAKADNLTGGKNTLFVAAKGFNTLSVIKQSSFFVATTKPNIRLATPAFGVTAYSVFNASVETPLPSKCTYVYDTPSPPSATDFEFLKAFEGLGTMHTTTGLTIPYGAQREYLLHTYCKFDMFGIVQRTFNLSLDPDPAVIQKAFAEPAVIAEQYIPGQELFATTLKVQLNKPGFCKYSLITSTLSEMEGTFPGYDTAPKQSLAAEVNVTERKTYEYYVTCKGKNQLTTTPVKIPFAIDLTQPLYVSSNTPQGFGTLEFTIGVVSNKRVFCYFGEQEDDTTKCMGACTSGYTQWQKISVNTPGKYTYYVKCSHVSGEQSDVIEIPVIIDTTPPEMEYVKDDGVLEDPEITWSQSKIRVAFKATDPESNISHYLVTLQGQTDKQTVFKDYVSNVTNGMPFYISTTTNGSPFRLTNGKRYSFKVKAVNRVGLESEAMESDGVVVDITQIPEECKDGEQNQNESDVDCGGTCEGCPEGAKCSGNADCATNYCADGICVVASCEDAATNGLESDIDCGGQACAKCANGRTCIVSTDCESDYCDMIENICTDAPPCADKTLSPGETDIDCGGTCAKCGEGKNCMEQTDCAEGLSCDPITKTCISGPIGDSDEDGITDEIDKCLGTPPGEEVDAEGCGLSQKYSLGDEINDKWRMDYFGCIDCPEAAANADPDRDKLTNLEEYRQGTNPTKKDTDGDGWRDNVELEKGTDPTNPASHPPSILKGMLWVLLVLLILGAAGYGAYLLVQAKKYKPEKPKEEEKIVKEVKREELEKLKTFAKEEEIPEKDWISLEKEIKKKPLAPKEFEKALEKLKKIAYKEKIKPEEPLMRLRAMLEELGAEERSEILSKWKQLRAGLLTKEEMQELFKRLKITAEYYKQHKEELEKELEGYGRRKRRH